MFEKARLKLTAWYLLIIMTVSIAFSLVFYQRLRREIDRIQVRPPFVIERRLPDPDLLQELHDRLVLALVFINGGILVVAGFLGYWLAGKTLEPIAAMVDEQGRFISDASHELKTPLTSLKTAFEVYLRGKKLAPAKTLVQESLVEVNKLQNLTEGLLRLTHDRPLPLGPVSLAAVLNHVGRRIKPLAAAKKIKLVLPQTDFKIKGNQDQLVDLLVILLDNAVKYSRPKSPVKVTAEKIDHQISIKVIDRGMGISRQDLKHIFDRFYRADAARSRSGSGGYGLGLAIAQKIVQENNGTIKVTSRLGRGSTFQLIFSSAA